MVLFAASECVPFIKTGGLADVVGSLPLALGAEGVSCKVILPLFSVIKHSFAVNYLGYSFVDLGNKKAYLGVYNYFIDDIEFLFIDNEEYFGCEQIYGHGNDGERFTFFSLAILEALNVISWYPSIIHANDWQTGLIPYLLQTLYNSNSNFAPIKTVFTIHNIQYQGVFPKDISSIFSFPVSGLIEMDGKINFLKAGIACASVITTVSPTYRLETMNEEFSFGLHSILWMRNNDYYGILNGLDYDKFNPETDKSMFQNFSRSDVNTIRPLNKRALQEILGLKTHDVMLCGLVSRLADQKGINVLRDTLDNIIPYTDIQFILMGSGEREYEEYFEYLHRKYPDRVKVYIGYNDEMAMRIYGGVDCLFVPSNFEPCGLSQMIAMRYGAVPLVRETGGLKDTIVPFNAYSLEGTGFSFSGYAKEDFTKVLYYAFDNFRFARGNWHKIIDNMMACDFSWAKSASKYHALYTKLTGGLL